MLKHLSVTLIAVTRHSQFTAKSNIIEFIDTHIKYAMVKPAVIRLLNTIIWGQLFEVSLFSDFLDARLNGQHIKSSRRFRKSELLAPPQTNRTIFNKTKHIQFIFGIKSVIEIQEV